MGRVLHAVLLAALLLASAHSLPPRRSRADTDDFVAVATNKLATKMLQHYSNVDANIAFSPLGVSALLAILAEGARGETREQLVATLHLPAEPEKTREVYKAVLTRLKDKHTLNHPEFRNWFYVYKNYTVEQCFRDVLEQNYLTEVRDVENPNRVQSEVAQPQPVVTSTSTEEPSVIVHKPVHFHGDHVKVELPEVPEEVPEVPEEVPEVPEAPAAPADNELDKSDRYPVKGEGLDPLNLPADIHPLAQVPISPSMQLDFSSLPSDVAPPFKPSQEDSIRTIMVQEAVVMGEALKENHTKTVEEIKDREEEMKEALEKDVLDKEQVKVEMEEQIETEKELQNALEDKINKQEAVKEVLEENMKKEEEAIDKLMDDIAKLEKEKVEMGAVPDMLNGGQIRVAVVVMNDEEVKMDQAPVKEEQVNHAEEEKGAEGPFKDVSMFDRLGEKTKGEGSEPEGEEPQKPVEGDHTPSATTAAAAEETPTATPTATPATSTVEEATPDEEMMVLERKARSAEDIASSFSGNNLVGRAAAANRSTSMMIAFNALYFKGAWKTPFMPQLKDGAHVFYTADGEKVAVPMMHAEGTFAIGKIADLDSVAIDIPYEGGRYSLLVILPNARTGLNMLTASLAGLSLCELSKSLVSQRVEVCLPSFDIQTTTKPIRALNKLGVSHVFDRDTVDLTGISPVSGLYVDDMSQLVTLNVDLSTSSTNFLTASGESAMTRAGSEKFVADHPFLYFVHDVVDNIIIVAGKVMNPSVQPDDFQPEV